MLVVEPLDLGRLPFETDVFDRDRIGSTASGRLCDAIWIVRA